MEEPKSLVILERKLRFWQNAVVWPCTAMLLLGFGFYFVREQIRARS